MNKELNTIFLQIDPEDHTGHRGSGETWCVDQINDSDIKYVRADIVRTDIIENILDETGIAREIHRIDYDTGNDIRTVLSIHARVEMLASRLRYQEKENKSHEQETREEQGEKITSMVRQRRNNTEHSKKGKQAQTKEETFPTADEIADTNRIRYWENKSDED